jgi:signal peptidase I
MKLKINMEGTKGTIFYVFLGIFLAFGLNTCFAFALSTDMPIVAVESNSMTPTFYKGDILIIQGVADAKDYVNLLTTGDIIVFSPEDRDTPIVHRIVDINPDQTFQTMGDANKGQLPSEKHINPEQIHGKVMFVIPYLGWIKIGVMEILIPNMLVFVLISAAVIFLYTINKKYR